MKRIILFVFGLFFLCSCTVENSLKNSVEINEIASKTDYALGTIITVRVFEAGGNPEKAINLAFERLREIEKIASSKLPESELSFVNDNAENYPVPVSDELFSLLKTGLNFSAFTNGAFDITLGNLINLWNINGTDVSGEKSSAHKIPGILEIENAVKKCGYENLFLDDESKSVRFTNDIKLDLGAIAKGYAADEMKRILIENNISEAILDLGGNINIIGDKYGNGYNVGITNPRATNKTIGFIKLANKSAVCSGDYERYFIENGIRYHHIIDKKIGYPSNSGLISVTVITESSVHADILSTAFFVLGKEKALELANKLKQESIISSDLEIIFITDDNQITTTEGIVLEK